MEHSATDNTRQLHVSIARFDELHEIASIYGNGVEPNVSGHFAPRQLSSIDGIAALVAEERLIWFSARHDGVLVGALAAVPHLGSKESPAAYLFGLYVHPAYRARGVGSRLTQMAIHRLSESHEAVLVEVPGRESRQARLFERAGFRAVGFLPFAQRTPAGLESVTPYLWLRDTRVHGEVERRLRELQSQYCRLRTHDTGRFRVAQSGVMRLDNIEAGANDEETGANARFQHSWYAYRDHRGVQSTAYVVFDGLDFCARIHSVEYLDPKSVAPLLMAMVSDLTRDVGAQFSTHLDLAFPYGRELVPVLCRLGFVPAAYLPGFVEVDNERWDLLRFVFVTGFDLRHSLRPADPTGSRHLANSIISTTVAALAANQ